MKKIFLTSVQIAVVAEDEIEASSAISEALTENLEQSGAILDWGYNNVTIPFVDRGEYDSKTYREGDAIMSFK